jgi:hypothetical protein
MSTKPARLLGPLGPTLLTVAAEYVSNAGCSAPVVIPLT